MKTDHKRLTLCRREDWMPGTFFNVALEGDRLVLQGAETTGLAILRSIDAGEPGFRWGRLTLDCTLPEDSLIRVYAYASDDAEYGPWPDLDRGIGGLTGTAAQIKARLAQVFGDKLGDGADLDLNKTGRWLWLMLELVATGSQKPEIAAVTLQISGDHMSDYLPAIYQADDFTHRFTSIFDGMLMDMEREICQLPRRFDYRSTDDEMLRYLAGWVCIDQTGSREELTAWISTALEDYDSLYTVQGVCRSVRRLTGLSPIVIEHDSVDPNAAGCRNPALYRRLYGDDPFRFFVLLPEDTFPTRSAMEQFLQQMQTCIPAGTQLELVLLKRCVQLDWHTYLGVNSVISSYVPIAIDENITIHYDTMIGGSGSE